MANIPYADYGIPTVQSETFTQVELFAGDTPNVVTDYGIVPAALATAGIPAWTPLVVDPETRIVALATAEADANAISVVTIQAGAPADSNLPIYKAGMFNIRALNWDVSYDTDAKKFSAFAAATDAQIHIKAPYGQ